VTAALFDLILAPNPSPMTLEGTNTYVVGSGKGYVIDPGPAIESHIAAVREAAERRGGLAGYLLTHSHPDHADGVPMLGAPKAMAAEAGLTEIPTPGHSDDHVCFLLGTICFSGDLILGAGSTFVPPDGGSLIAYLDSLHRLAKYELTLICPGHGPLVHDPAAKIREYIEHREERERKLLAALDSGERSRERLLDIAWDDVPAELRPAAALTMQAHLEKLKAEDRLPEGVT